MEDISISIIPKLLGHEEQEKNFLHSFRNNRLPHAFLVTGQKGIGKCGLAVRIAVFLLSDANAYNNSENLYFEQQSSLVKQIKNNSHPDFSYLYFGMNSLTKPYKPMNVISVEHIRQAMNLNNHTTISNTSRVIIIDDAETMNRQAQNALLKTLEEPNPNTYIILCTSKPNSLLPTIRSRCCSYNLKPINDEKIQEYLEQKYADLSSDELKAYIKLANGSIGVVDNLIKNKALNIYNIIVDAIKNGNEQIYTLINAISGIKNKNNFQLFLLLFDNFTYRCFKANSNNLGFECIIKGEEQAYEKIKQKYNGLKMIDWINQAKQNINDVQAPVYLDLKSVILTLFLSLQENN
ncbi:MAG: AAA family ATPase [Alphaproteobacteria bacterium]|nr:AAA family ATPase [Alphaproteobacteria bacterium]